MAGLNLSGYGPQALGGDTMQLYQLLLQSPQFQQALQQNALAGQGLQANIAQGLAQRGLATSGIGTVANALGNSAQSFGEGALRGGLFGESMQNALRLLMGRLQAYSQYQTAKANQPSPFERIFGSTLGAVGSALPFFAPQKPSGINQYGGAGMYNFPRIDNSTGIAG